MGGNRRSGKNKNVKIFAYLPSKVPYIFQIKDMNLNVIISYFYPF